MCGRFTLTTPSDQLAAAFPEFAIPEYPQPRFNIAPGQKVLAVPNTQDRRGSLFQWGLVPHWAKEPSIGHRLINARAETIDKKPSFRLSFRRRRCILLSDGFFEWRKAGKNRIPFYVRMKQGRPFAMAGLWDIWHPEEEVPLRSCAIITTEANQVVQRIHDRMPVILSPADYNRWLSTEDSVSAGILQQLLKPCPSSGMEAYRVSEWVNYPGHDSSECTMPLAGENIQSEDTLF